MKLSKTIFTTAIASITLVMLLWWWHTKEHPEPDEPIDDTTNNGYNGLGEPYTANFSLSEFHCKDGTPVPETLYGNVYLLMQNLQALRDYLGWPISINSAFRTPSHNESVGGKTKSSHLTAKAADIVVLGKSPRQVKEAIEYLISTGKMQEGGIGLYNTFVHYDVRGYKARW